MYLGPISMNLTGSAVGTFSSLFGMYRFRSVRLRYVPTVATSTAAQLTFGVQFDGGFVSSGGFGTPTSETIGRLPYVMETVAWQGASISIPRCPHMMNAYYCDRPNSGTDLREFEQGVVFGISNNTTAMTYGKLYIDYCIEFYGRGTMVSSPI